MNTFIRTDQYQFIKAQTQYLINGYGTTNDIHVLNTLKSLAQERTISLFPEITEEQLELLKSIVHVRNQLDAEHYLSQIKPYVIPFKNIGQQTIQKLFPKVKKLKAPSLESVDFKEISYLAWDDKGTNRRYIIFNFDNKLLGVYGKYNISNIKGICSLCNQHGQVGMFVTEKKGTTQDTYRNKGNYICADSMKCNQHVTSQEKLMSFIEWLIS